MSPQQRRPKTSSGLHQLCGIARAIQRQLRGRFPGLIQRRADVVRGQEDPRGTEALQFLPDPLLPGVFPHHRQHPEAPGGQQLDEHLRVTTVAVAWRSAKPAPLDLSKQKRRATSHRAAIGTVQDHRIARRQLRRMLLEVSST